MKSTHEDETDKHTRCVTCTVLMTCHSDFEGFDDGFCHVTKISDRL